MAKKTKILMIIAISLLVLVGGCISAYAFIKPIHNKVDTILMKPEKLYKKVETKNFADGAKSFSTMYSKAASAIQGNTETGVNTSVKVTLGEDMIKEMDIPELKSVKINANFGAKDKKSSHNYSVEYNDKKVVSLNTTIDNEKQIAYIQVPELSNDYLSLKPEELAPYLEKNGMSLPGVLKGYNADQYLEMMSGDYANELSASQQDIEDVIKRYSDIFVNCSTSVSKDLNCKGDVDGVKYNYTKLTSKITYQNVLDMGDKFIDELKDDDVIKKMVVDGKNVTEENYNQAIQEMKDSLDKAKDSDDVDLDDTFMTMITYVDSDMKVAGREFLIEVENKSPISEESIENTSLDLGTDSMPDLDKKSSGSSDKEKVEAGYITIDNSKKYAVKSWASYNDEDIFSVEGSADKNGEKYTGSFEFETGDFTGEGATKMTLKLEDFGYEDKEAQLISGKATISAEQDSKKFEIVFDCKVDNKKQTISTILNQDGKMMITFDISYEETQVADIKLPDSSAKIYNALNETEMQSYLENVDIEGFTKDVSDILGKDLTDEILGGIKGNNSGNIGDNGDPAVEPSTDGDEDANGSTDISGVSMNYDFINVKYTFEGKPINLPADYMTLATKIAGKDQTVKAGESPIFRNTANTMSVSLKNTTEADATFAKCKLQSITVYDGEGAASVFSVNGITIGSTPEQVNAAFGTDKIKAETNYISITSTGGTYSNIMISFRDGKVDSIYSYFSTL